MKIEKTKETVDWLTLSLNERKTYIVIFEGVKHLRPSPTQSVICVNYSTKKYQNVKFNINLKFLLQCIMLFGMLKWVFLLLNNKNIINTLIN